METWLKLNEELPCAQLGSECTNLRFSDDNRTIYLGDETFRLSTMQSTVMRKLYDAWKAGQPDVSQESLLDAAGSRSKRIRDLFKNTPVWGRLIVKCGKDMFSINIEAIKGATHTAPGK